VKHLGPPNLISPPTDLPEISDDTEYLKSKGWSFQGLNDKAMSTARSTQCWHHPWMCDNPETLNTPLAAARALSELVRGKVVCDLEAMRGDVLRIVKGVAREVHGVSSKGLSSRTDNEILDIQNVDETRKINALMTKGCEVYYAYDPPNHVQFINSLKSSKHKLILGADWQSGKYHSKDWVELLNDGRSSRTIKVPFDEGDGYRQYGVFGLFVYEQEP
jgi:hypothetical protein